MDMNLDNVGYHISGHNGVSISQNAGNNGGFRIRIMVMSIVKVSSGSRICSLLFPMMDNYRLTGQLSCVNKRSYGF